VHRPAFCSTDNLSVERLATKTTELPRNMNMLTARPPTMQ
jgi:hypothetical protein